MLLLGAFGYLLLAIDHKASRGTNVHRIIDPSETYPQSILGSLSSCKRYTVR